MTPGRRHLVALLVSLLLVSVASVAGGGFSARPAAAIGTTPADGTYQGALVGGGLNRPIVGTASTPSGNGYWLVAS
ncbi:MAG: hypothetical protein ACRDZW_09950, partial [Acidimicrobiales bacterium]